MIGPDQDFLRSALTRVKVKRPQCFGQAENWNFSVAQMLRIGGSESGVVLYHPSHPGQVQQSNDHDHGKMFGHDRT